MFWNIKATQTEPENSEQFIARFLQSRNLPFDPESIKAFTTPVNITLEYLLKETGIDKVELTKAVTLINESIKSNRPIIIYGDYDVDGVCATATLWQSLHNFGADVLPFIPRRLDHGYGLSEAGISDALKLHSTEIKPLIITVDNGITANKVIDKYQKTGIDFIITDHHLPPTNLPKTQALVHTTAVCGTTVAFILSFALTGSLPPLDLVALATVCDQLPLLGINRQLVLQGLPEIRSPRRIGLTALLDQAGITNYQEIDTYHLGFVIGPRINAAGRLGHALDALRLLCTPNQSQAGRLSDELGLLNQDRQDLTQVGIKKAIDFLQDKDTLPSILLISSPDLHEGIIGLIAAKLSDRFHRPAIAISTATAISKASARSIDGVDITSILQKFADLFIDIGGHAGAAGFTLKTENIALLETKLQTVEISADLLKKSYDIDLLLHPNQDLSVINSALKVLSPFGPMFPTPIFALTNLLVSTKKIVGAAKSHLQLVLITSVGKTARAICFNQAEVYPSLDTAPLNIAFYLQENTYNGYTNLQLNVQNIQTKDDLSETASADKK